MANQSTSKKSLRSFHVRDGLWKLFEVKSQEMDCSVDYLINEAMRLYARTHNFASSVRVTGTHGSLAPTSPGGQQPGAIPRPAGGVPPVRPSVPPAYVPRPPATGSGMAPMPPAGYSVGPGPVTGTGQYPHASSTGVPPAAPPITGAGHVPVPSSTGPAIPRPADTGRPTLTMIFQGRKLPITTAQFIIGRGSKSSDLAIKDPNISRKHAAIIFHNGAFYLKDLGSTNGIEYKGKQVDSKRIDEGDVFTICGYDLHFTYSV